MNESRRKLHGLSGDFGGLDRSADEIALETGIDRNVARELLFTGTSQQLSSGDVKKVAALSPVVAPEIGIQFAADLKDQFSKEALTAERALNTAITAADTSKLDAAAILPQIQKASIGAAVLGAESSDTAALVSVLASKFGGETGTVVKSLLNQFATTDVEGLNTPNAIGNIIRFQSLPRDQKQRFVGGNKEVLGALKVASDSLRQIVATDKAIERQQLAAGTEESVYLRELREAYDPNTRQGRLAIEQRNLGIAKVTDEISQEQNFGITATRNERQRLQQSTRIREDFDGSAVGQVVAINNDFFLQLEQFMRGNRDEREQNRRDEEQTSHLRNIDNNMQRIEANTRPVEQVEGL